MRAYKKHEAELIEIYQARYGKGFPNRYYSLRGQALPRFGECPLTSRALMPQVLRERLGLGERVVTPRPEVTRDHFGATAKT